MAQHYNVKLWAKNEDYWIDDMPKGEPTNARYYDTRLTAAKNAAKAACDNGTAIAKVCTTAGELVTMYADCGGLGTCWIDGGCDD